MSRFATQFGFTAVVLFSVALTFLCFAPHAHATIVGAQSFGDDMAGGTITVNFSQSSQVAPIVAGAPGQALASVAGFFQFSVAGDTFLADWRLQNLTTSDTIRSVIFDLNGSNALFDDNSAPSTPNGFAGRAGAVQVNVGAPFILASSEQAPWPDIDNTGDEFLKEEILYDDFGPGFVSVWRDDTDVIGKDTGPETPEPASAALILIGALAMGQLRSRHQR